MILLSALAIGFAGQALSLRVEGPGYLRFVRDGRIVYATSATLTAKGGILVANDLPITPSVRIPADSTSITVDAEGNVLAAKTPCGRLILARFDNPPIQEKGFYVSAGRAAIGYPGTRGFGRIVSQAKSAPPAVSRDSATIVVRQTTEVETPAVTLGQIADIQGQGKAAAEALVYGSAPTVGIDMPITAPRIRAILLRAGIDAEITVPKSALVRRKCQAIPQSEFVAAAIKAGQAKLGAELPMSCSDAQADFKAPLGTTELRSEAVIASGTTLAVTIAVYVDGKPVNSRTVNLRIDASAQVRAGTAVKIVMKSAGLSVEVAGRTRTAGLIGQTVTVVTETGSVLTGTVIGADRVEVKI